MVNKPRRSKRRKLKKGSVFATLNQKKFKPKNRLSTRKKIGLKRGSFKNINKEKVKKMAWSSLGFLGIAGAFLAVAFLIYLQSITKDLPTVENPFDKLASSTIYDKNGVELYRVSHKDFERDLLTPGEYVPETVKWSFLAAEDEEFYEHGGFDLTAIIRCYFIRTLNRGTCGGSTITQQVIKITKLTEEQTYTRKIRELIMSMQLERTADKDEILNIYLNVVPQGSSVLGAKSGANFYFGKEIGELTYAESAVLAAIVQQPSLMSPTVGSDIEANKKRLFNRTDYILDQMIENINRINQRIKDENEEHKDEENYTEQKEVTKEDLEKAKDEVRALEFRKPTVNIKAPHFVFYVQKLLQERGYNGGEPFTASEIETGGLKIYTTLDYELQEIAEKYISSSEQGHAGYYRNNFGASNSALMTLDPKTGAILTMVGSKCYQNNEYIQNCDELDEQEGDKFDPDVNVLDTLQSPGSTAKAVGYYIAFNEGTLSAGSTLADIPIQIGSYRPKNWNGAFNGLGTVRNFLANSLNIPAIFAVESYGVQKYIDVAREFGYTTLNNPNGYGPSIILGGFDVKPVEHAQAFTTFANGGRYVQHEVISKIEDAEGNVIYEHEPQPKDIANPAAIYMVNHILSPKGSGSIAPPKHMRDREVAGKTGTSEENKDTWFVMWSPDFVTLGWMGNNDNSRMTNAAFGSQSVEPWVGEYMESIAGAFPDKTPFTRPEGVIYSGGYCPNNTDENECDLNSKDLAIANNVPPSYLRKKVVKVCIDQPDRLAREIDIQTGFAQDKVFNYVVSPAKSLQSQVDKYFQEKEGVPTEECDVPRLENPNKPDGIIISPQPGQTYEDNMLIDARGIVGEGRNVRRMEFFIGDEQIASTRDASYNNTVNLKKFKNGQYRFKMEITDSRNNSTTKSINIYIGSSNNPGVLSLSTAGAVKPGNATTVDVKYTDGTTISDVLLYQQSLSSGITTLVGEMRKKGENSYEYNWTSAVTGEYKLYAVGELPNDKYISSNMASVKVEQGD